MSLSTTAHLLLQMTRGNLGMLGKDFADNDDTLRQLAIADTQITKLYNDTAGSNQPIEHAITTIVNNLEQLANGKNPQFSDFSNYYIELQSQIAEKTQERSERHQETVALYNRFLSLSEKLKTRTGLTDALPALDQEIRALRTRVTQFNDREKELQAIIEDFAKKTHSAAKVTLSNSFLRPTLD